MFDLNNIFDVFLNQLLNYPNCDDPLNHEAAKLMMSDFKVYEEVVLGYVRQFAQADDGDGFEEVFSNASFSELSDTSDIFFEEDIFF